ncbi:hypothetical protein L873DRAFT_1026608 [Choiromyces venosus 120613-1]|uniref:Uncharacterized protein n=1 Tax=Choiromyces venosus 120613-1 TaxID=1336337 RepID=A0A3N4JQQ8_9PEZI|nr:hypothetical protein L873DRAFT_1026608 [Choiromyces venosus 120613-1]
MSSKNVIDTLREEVRVLNRKVQELEIQLRLRPGNPVPTPSPRSERARLVPTEPRAIREGTPVAPRALVQKSRTWARVVAEGKKRKVEEGNTRGAEEEKKVGRAPDPEENRGKGVPMMVKVGGVRWDDGIGGVVEGLKEAGFVSCEGGRWLVDEEEREKRIKQGRRSSTVVVRVCGREKVGELCRAGLWVGGVWCSVRRFVAVPVKRKEAGWVRVVEKVEESVGAMEMNVEGAVMAMGEKVAVVEKSVAGVAEEQGDRVRLLEEKVMEAIGDGMKVLGDGMGLLRREIMEKVEKMENERLVQTQIKVVPAGPSGYRRR